MKSLSDKLRVMIMAILLIFLFSSFTYAEDLDKPYPPTRKEWLEISIFHLIKVTTDYWRQRIGFSVWIVENENRILITLTSVDWEESPTEEIKEKNKEIVKRVVEEFLKRYDWSENLKIFVKFT